MLDPKMSRGNLLFVTFCVLLIAPPTCSGQEVLFRDDFDESVSADLAVAGHVGERSVVDGWYQWTPTSNSVMNSVTGGYPDDVSLRTSSKMLAVPTGDWVFTGVVGRWDRSLGTSYYAGIATDGRIGIGISGGPVLATTPTALDVLTQEVEIQFDLLGDRLHLTAWEAGAAQPGPQISITDDSLASGAYAGLSYNPRSSDLQTVAFDYFEIVAIPEPCAAQLLVVGLCGLVACRRKRLS